MLVKHRVYPSLGRGFANSAAGSTLVELVMLAMILGLVFGGAITSLGQGFVMVELSRDATRVSQILQSDIEDLRTKKWGDIEAMSGTTVVDNQTGSSTPFDSRYTLTRTITASKADQLELKLTATWKDSRGLPHSRSYFTYFTKNGLNDYYFRTI